MPALPREPPANGPIREWTALIKAPSKANAFLICGLAISFSCVFFFLKHSPLFRNIIPCAGDPYDAIGFFGLIAANLLAEMSLARLLLPQFTGSSASSIRRDRHQDDERDGRILFCVNPSVS